MKTNLLTSPEKEKNNEKAKVKTDDKNTPSTKEVKILKSKLAFFKALTFTSAFSEKANKLGIFTPEQLITHLPSRYEDLSKIYKIYDSPVGTIGQFEVMIKAHSTRGFGNKKNHNFQVTDGSADALIKFFNLYPAQLNLLKIGASIRIYGEIKLEGVHKEFLHPRWQLTEKAGALQNKLSPVYPLTQGLSQAVLSNQINKTLPALPYDLLPASLTQNPKFTEKLPALKKSLEFLHNPPADASIEWLLSGENPYRQRCSFDELLALQIILRRLRQKIKTRSAHPQPNNHLVTQLLKQLPFQLTKAQNKAWREIATDLEGGHPMARLLQGDVGSGKTIIALFACLKALSNGGQTLVMAPTEILAEQHYRRFTQMLRPLGINVGWLSSSVGNKERQELISLVSQKLINIVVGTHALIEDTLTFPNLTLVVIDEQHRFGVRQRLRLQERAEKKAGAIEYAPHQLMLSATPIPRTLAMSHYAHLDLSIIDELPPGRQPIRTRLVNNERRSEILKYLLKVIDEGRQVYWVCPLIEESETLQLQTAQQTYTRLAEELPELSKSKRIGILHGRMQAYEKNQIMADFSANKIALLVSTTVIEVGVDVANACYMVIENAERFGLAQLHQLRGRVGRGEHASVCILLFQEPLTDVAKARLKVIYENTDGFEVAKFDLQIRGPGEIIGDKQSGLPTLRFANIISDFKLLALAQEFAPIMIAKHQQETEQLIEFWFGEVGELYAT